MKKKVKTNWSAQTTDVKPEHKFMCDKVGVSYEPPVDAFPFDYFSLLLPETFFFQSVVNETNSNADLKQEMKGVPDKNWTKVTVEEIKLFIYIQYLFGIYHMPDTSMYWSTDPLLQVPAIADVMSKGRFKKTASIFISVTTGKHIPKVTQSLTHSSKSGLCWKLSSRTARNTTIPTKKSALMRL